MPLQLSKQAIIDLRIALQKSYGEVFGSSLSDQEINEIGSLLLNTLAENLKIKI
ncbi:MAG: hypothetical protein NTZ44_01880 [Candidatus Nomurabacteria bacterium]|nr:hypothetical protein [Candidatus Nomurabacteria bacterium]